jgi:hypothetical protein
VCLEDPRDRRATDAMAHVLQRPLNPCQPTAVSRTNARPALATATTWGGLGLEALVATLCIVPAGAGVELARHIALMLFCGLTYAFAPVAGFGWLIATMGLAQSRSDHHTLRTAYIALFFLVLLNSEIPWAGVLAHWTKAL